MYSPCISVLNPSVCDLSVRGHSVRDPLIEALSLYLTCISVRDPSVRDLLVRDLYVLDLYLGT